MCLLIWNIHNISIVCIYIYMNIISIVYGYMNVSSYVNNTSIVCVYEYISKMYLLILSWAQDSGAATLALVCWISVTLKWNTTPHPRGGKSRRAQGSFWLKRVITLCCYLCSMNPAGLLVVVPTARPPSTSPWHCFGRTYAGGSSSRLDRDLSTLPSASAWLYICCTDVWKDWLEQKVRRDPADPECIRCRTPIAGIVCMQGIRLLHYGCLNRGGSSSYRDSWHSHVSSSARALHGHRLSDDYCPLQMLEEGEEEETNWGDSSLFANPSTCVCVLSVSLTCLWRAY